MAAQPIPNPVAELKAALDVFETSIATPIVPGELAAWIAETIEAWSRAAAQIQHHTAELHPKQFEEIADQDSELLSRIDLMKAEDVAIETERVALGQAIARLDQLGPIMELDEGKATRVIEKAVNGATQFTARVRKQAIAVQAWYVEAFQRDRGVVD